MCRRRAHHRLCSQPVRTAVVEVEAKLKTRKVSRVASAWWGGGCVWPESMLHLLLRREGAITAA